MKWLALCLACTMCAGVAGAAEELPGDAETARALFERGDFVGALPYYARLTTADLVNSVYAERHAHSLSAQMEVLPAGAPREQLIARARAEADRARKLGNGSGTLQVLLAWLGSNGVHSPDSEGARFRAAEVAIGKGDLDAALAGYKAIAATDPRSYLAHLYAGNVYLRKGDVAGAADWFGRAIAIDPDIETAYRYWGDTLAVTGDERGALPMYIRAVVAEPYRRTSWAGLHGWAERNGRVVLAPQLPLPEVTLQPGEAGKGPQVSINMEPSLEADQIGRAAWLAYGLNRGAWMKGRFFERNPAASTYRRSLQEEVESMRVAFEIIRKDVPDVAQAPATVRDLAQLVQDGLLEPYVLLVVAGDGIVQDYAAYRQRNRNQLARFIEKYMIGLPTPAK